MEKTINMENPLKTFAMKHFNLVEGTPVTEPAADMVAPVAETVAKVFAQIADAEGKIYSYEGDTLTVGAILYDGEEGSEILAAAGTITLEDGSMIVVGEGGLVEQLIEAGSEEVPAEEEALQAPAAPKSVEETVTTKTSFEAENSTGELSEDNLQKILFAVASLIEPLTTRLEALEGTSATELSAAKSELVEKEAEVAKLSAMPAAEPHTVVKSTTPSKPKAFSKFEKMKASGNFTENTQK